MRIETLVCPVCREVLNNYYETNENNYFFCRTCGLNFDIYPAIHKEYWYMEWDGIELKFFTAPEKTQLLVFKTKEAARDFIQNYIRDSHTTVMSLDDIVFRPIDHFPIDAIDATEKYIKINGDSHSLEDLPYVSS